MLDKIAKIKAISSDSHHLQCIKLHHFKLSINLMILWSLIEAFCSGVFSLLDTLYPLKMLLLPA